MKKSILVLFAFAVFTFGQQIGEFELDESEFGDRHIKGHNKRIYIADFQVNYQLLLNWIEKRQGGRQFGGGVKGDATAQLLLGLPAISEQNVIDLTDSLFAKYKEHLREKGYFLINDSLVANSEVLEDYRKEIGGRLERVEGRGDILVRPTNFEYYERIPKNYFDSFYRAFAQNHPHKLAEEFGIIVNKVYLHFSLFEDSESGFSKAITKLASSANIEVTTRFKLSPLSNVNFYFENSNVKYNPENGIPIKNVVEEKEYTATQNADRDSYGADYGSLRIFSADNKSFKNMQNIKCDPIKYQKGASSASEIFFNSALLELNKKY